MFWLLDRANEIVRAEMRSPILTFHHHCAFSFHFQSHLKHCFQKQPLLLLKTVYLEAGAQFSLEVLSAELLPVICFEVWAPISRNKSKSEPCKDVWVCYSIICITVDNNNNNNIMWKCFWDWLFRRPKYIKGLATGVHPDTLEVSFHQKTPPKNIYIIIYIYWCFKMQYFKKLVLKIKTSVWLAHQKI